MAITFLNAVEVERTGTTDPQTWTHVPGGTAAAIVVSIVHGTSSTDHVLTVTYGGVSMTRVVRATDTATEPGAAELWFLGSGIPTGNQTVSADLASATTDDIHFVSMSFSAPGDCTAFTSGSINENAANPSVTLTYGGRTAMAVAALYGGGASPASFTPNGNCSAVADFAIAAFYSTVIRQTTAGTADFAIGGTAATDDVAFVALALSEIRSIAVSAGASTVSGPASFSSFRRAILNGLDSAQAEGTGWDAVKTTIDESAVVRTSSTVVTITLPAIPSYDITASEVITDTVPGAALTGAVDIVATPTLGVAVSIIGAVTGSSTVTATGSASSVGVGADGGAVTATAVGKGSAVSAGSIAGLVTAAMIGLSTAVSVGAATGSVTVTGTSAGSTGVGAVSGSASVLATGRATATSVAYVPYTDTFDRATLGTDWQTALGAPWVTASSLYLKPSSTFTTTAVRRVGLFPADQFAEVSTEVPTPGGLNRTDAGPAVRMDVAGNCYYVRLLSTDLALYKYNAGTHTYLNDVVLALANDTFYTIRLSVVGTTLSVYLNGILKFTATDSTFASGNPGCAGVTGDAAILPRFDNFSSTLGSGAESVAIGQFLSTQPGAALGSSTVTAVGAGLSQSVGLVTGLGAAVGRSTAFVDVRRPILNGIVSAQSETQGWNAIRALIPDSAVVRTSNTVVTITLSAVPSYDISALETLTVTVPAIALNGAAAIVATPTITLTPSAQTDGAVDGTADVEGFSQSIYSAVAASAGSATVTAVGVSTTAGASLASATGAATVSSTSTVAATGVGVCAGVAGVDGLLRVGSVGFVAAFTTVTGVGGATIVRLGASANGSSAQAVGQSVALSVGAVFGSAVVIAATATGSIGAVTGTSSILGIGQSVATSTGNTAGADGALATGAGLGIALGVVVGAATVNGLSSGFSTGTSQGTAIVNAVGVQLFVRVGSAAGVAIVNGVGFVSGVASAIGTASGGSTASAVGSFSIPGAFRPAWASNSNQRVA
jgi:hypothetical protein